MAQTGDDGKRQTTVMLSPATRRKIKALRRLHGTQSEVVAIAIDRLYLAEIGSDEPAQGEDRESEHE
jgi:hypothetical protein